MSTHRIGTLDIDKPRLDRELEQIARFGLTDVYNEQTCGRGPYKTCVLWDTAKNATTSNVADGARPLIKTKYAEQLPYLSEIIERSFNLQCLNKAILAIIANCAIIPHKDFLRVTENRSRSESTHRIHVPLITNEACYFLDGNIVYRMRFGEVWYFDASRLHSAASFSDQKRVHLLLDFIDIDNPARLVNVESENQASIPSDSVCSRSEMTKQEEDALLSLAGVIDMDNYKDIFSIVIKKHFRKDGGDNFFWGTLMAIASASRNQDVSAKINEIYRYYRDESSQNAPGQHVATATSRL